MAPTKRAIRGDVASSRDARSPQRLGVLLRALQSQLLVAGRVLVEALATRHPLVLAVEDIHWPDAASIELLTILLELTDFAPLLVLVTEQGRCHSRESARAL